MHEVRVQTPAGIETGTLRDDAVITDTGSYAVGAIADGVSHHFRRRAEQGF